MKKILEIKKIQAMQVLDSRGNPTVQVEIMAGNSTGVAMVPSGASTGQFEAIELRDNIRTKYLGKGVENAVKNVNERIAEKLIGQNVYDQKKIDKLLNSIDGTSNKESLGANAILGVSIAVARCAANSLDIPLYQYLGGIQGVCMPKPMMNILNGGKHSENNLSIQEFMIVPKISKKFEENLRVGVEIYHTLKRILKEKGYSVGVGDEGGFAPNLESEEHAIQLIMQAIKEAGYEARNRRVFSTRCGSNRNV